MKCAHIPGSLVYIISFYTFTIHVVKITTNVQKRIRMYNAYLFDLIFVCIFKTALQYNSYNIGITVY